MNMNRGYIGYSMSVRAMESYERGEKPLTKWTKTDIVEGIKQYYANAALIKLASGLPLKTLREYCMDYCGWHHTGKYCSTTKFYKISEKLTVDFLQNLKEEAKEEAKEEIALIRYFWSENRGSKKHPRIYDCERSEIAIVSKNGKSAKLLNQFSKRVYKTIFNFKILEKISKIPNKNSKKWNSNLKEFERIY